MSNETCEPKKVRVRRTPRDMSWFPECGIDRGRIEFDHDPTIIATAYGNALVNANLDCATPFLFRREGNPVRLIYVGRDPKDKRVVVRELNATVLKSMLHEVAELGRATDSGWKPISPTSRDGWPSTIVEMLMARLATDPDVPVLKMLVTSPVLTKGGWLEETGYSPESGILARLDAEDWRPLITIFGNETLTAVAMVRDMFRDTKIERPESLALLVGVMVSIVARPLFGNVPLMSFESGNFGPGKTTTAEAIANVCLSPGEWTMIPCGDFDGGNAEMNKRISDALSGLFRYIILDDPAEGIQISHSDLATVLTSLQAAIRKFGRVGGGDSSTMVYSNQTVQVCANNPNYSPRLVTRKVGTVFEAGVPDGRQIKWERSDYARHVSENRADYNWAIRVLLDEAHAVMTSPAGRAKWEAWFMGLGGGSVRGNHREWFLYTAVVAELLGIDPNDILEGQEDYEAPTDPDREKRDWIVQRMLAIATPGKPVAASDMIPAPPTDPEARKLHEASVVFGEPCPFEGARDLGEYLRAHANGKWGADTEGVLWLIGKSAKPIPVKKVTGWVLKKRQA